MTRNSTLAFQIATRNVNHMKRLMLVLEIPLRVLVMDQSCRYQHDDATPGPNHAISSATPHLFCFLTEHNVLAYDSAEAETLKYLVERLRLPQI
ncbi:hypothetical protein WG66_003241 [Moniliophthora roreri]|nr:hypothetical protein WG66_003241 [Moniliophthora roreri]